MKKRGLFLTLLFFPLWTVVSSTAKAETSTFSIQAAPFAFFLKQLPPSLQTVVQEVNPKIEFIDAPRALNGMYNKRSNTLSHSKSLLNSEASLKRTFFHELAHVFDYHFKNYPRRDALLKLCPKTDFIAAGKERSTNAEKPPTCDLLSTVGTSVSKDPIFFARFGGRFDKREAYNENLIQTRSPDHYENENERELFAVNFEFFMMDPEYQCRRPLQFNFFKDLFSGFNPFPSQNCNPGLPFIKMEQMDAQLIKIDSSRIYRIDYLMASPASGDLTGGFGHAMLRLVICDPKRTVVNAECLGDLDHHLVVTFRGFITDEEISSWKGLRGAYPSNAYIVPFKSILEEYNSSQYRDLTSYPLQFSATDKSKILQQLALQHWSLERRYYFASNNCASEIVNLLRSALGFERLFNIATANPMSMKSWLSSMSLLDESSRPEIYKSRFPYWQKTLDKMTVNSKNKINFQDFLEMTVEERNQVYQSSLKNNPSPLTKALIRLLEFRIYSASQLSLLARVSKLVSGNNELNVSEFSQIFGFRNSGWIFNTQSDFKGYYGIPQQTELAYAQKFLEQRATRFNNESKKLIALYKKYLQSGDPEIEGLLTRIAESQKLLSNLNN